MSKISSENHGSVAILRLDHGATNAIGPDLLDDLDTALMEAASSYRGLLLAGGPKFFSIGFDLPQLLLLNRGAMTAFFDKFNHLVFKLFSLALPTVCAIEGHAIAGGNILALTCDFRYAAAHKKQIGLNEIRLGLPVPYLADLMLRQIIGDRNATEMLFKGNFMSLENAETLGLIDQLISPPDLESYALEKLEELAAFMQPAFVAIKANRVEAVGRSYQRHFLARRETFLDCWFTPPTQELLHKAAERF